MSDTYVVVIGAINIDIWGRSHKPLIARDSNPGSIRICAGGVGRNIAHNLRLLDVSVEMLTVIGDDGWADHIEADCRRLGIGLDRALHMPGERSSTYLCLTGPDGDLALGLSDTDITRHITPTYLESHLPLLNHASAVIFDGNLSDETIDYLTSRCRAPLFADPVSVSKAKKLIPVLPLIHTIKPNRQEAEALTGHASPAAAAEELMRLGVKRAFVSDGGGGICLAYDSKVRHMPAYDTMLVNATGGGDAAMAALCHGFLAGLSPEVCAQFALAAGALTVACAETINPALSTDAIRHIIQKAD